MYAGKQAAFKCGAGRFPDGRYDECAFSALVTCHRSTSQKDQENSIRVEMLCLDRATAFDAVKSLQEAHPKIDLKCEVNQVYLDPYEINVENDPHVLIKLIYYVPSEGGAHEQCELKV